MNHSTAAPNAGARSTARVTANTHTPMAKSTFTVNIFVPISLTPFSNLLSRGSYAVQPTPLSGAADHPNE